MDRQFCVESGATSPGCSKIYTIAISVTPIPIVTNQESPGTIISASSNENGVAEGRNTQVQVRGKGIEADAE